MYRNDSLENVLADFCDHHGLMEMFDDKFTEYEKQVKKERARREKEICGVERVVYKLLRPHEQKERRQMAAKKALKELQQMSKTNLEALAKKL